MGDPIIGLAGNAGGGGAATVLLMDGTPVVVAGGGGGGGGAASIIVSLGVPGGIGGTGCSGNGTVANVSGGGGGGGGICLGDTVQPGLGTLPFDSAALPAGQAEGGRSSCGAGGDGYAIVVFGT